MGLYKLYSSNVEVHYKSRILSKATFFTVTITVLNILLPFILAYRSRGFWLRSQSFYEQASVHFTYEYLLLAETIDPAEPIVCGVMSSADETINDQANCASFLVQEFDYNGDNKNDVLDFHFHLKIPPQRSIASTLIILELDFQLNTVCPVHMQTLAIISKEYAVPSSGWNYYGDLQFYQVAHLPCLNYYVDTTYNVSLFNYTMNNYYENKIDFIIGKYINRAVSTNVKEINSRSQYGHTGDMILNIRLRIPEVKIRYTPSVLQELKWAWPQYLSIVVVFYWIFNKIKRFAFYHRLFMAWEIVPWKKIC